VLPAQVPLADARLQHAHARCALDARSGDPASSARGPAALGDRLHQPYRAHLYPRSAELVSGAAALGRWGNDLGAGPTVLVWVERAAAAEVAGSARRAAAAWAELLRVDFVSGGAAVS